MLKLNKFLKYKKNKRETQKLIVTQLCRMLEKLISIKNPYRVLFLGVY